MTTTETTPTVAEIVAAFGVASQTAAAALNYATLFGAEHLADALEDDAEAIEDLAWQWAHAAAADVAYDACLAIDEAEKQRDGSYVVHLRDGCRLVWAEDDTRIGEPVPAVNWSVYHEERAQVAQGAWVGDVEQAEPSADALIAELQALIGYAS